MSNPQSKRIEGYGRREFLTVVSSGALAVLALPAAAFGQTLSELLEQSGCKLPVYFPIEVTYVGRVFKERSSFKLQVNDFVSTGSRNQFLNGNRDEGEFLKRIPIHEFITRGEAPFGSSPIDSYKGLEKVGESYLFKFFGSGEKLNDVKVSCRIVPPDLGQVVNKEVSAIEYFNIALNDHLVPALKACGK